MPITPRRAIVAAALTVSALCALGALACDGGSPARPRATAPIAPTTTAHAADGPAAFTVLAGAEIGAVDLEVFLPATISVREGDSITWRGKGPEGHSVVFLPGGRIDVLGPYFIDAPDLPGAKEFSPAYTIGTDHTQFTDAAVVSSGYFGVPAEGQFTLTFPDAGVYAYLCMIHPLTMRGTVVVNDAASAVTAPDAVLGGAEHGRDALIESSLAQQRAADERLRSEAARNPGAHVVAAGLDTEWGQVVAFVPGDVEIDAGDTVIFSNSPRDFHNVVFAPAGYDVPPFAIIKPAARGFRLIINPGSEREVPPPPNFGPDAYFSSGIMGITFPRMTWAVRFDTPGTYRYQCTVHVLAGMAGVITVRERTQ